MANQLRAMGFILVRYGVVFFLWTVAALSTAARQNGSTPDQQIPPVTTVVTVSAEAIPATTVPAVVTVVSRDFIENAHAENFADLIRKIPNLYLSQAGGRGGLTTLTIRGGKPNFTMVLIDGIPINDIGNILGGSFDFSSMSPENIDRIEIVSGPFSSWYGSEAISGVVNIISRREETRKVFEAGAEMGNFGTGRGHVSVGGTIGSSPYLLSGSYLTMGPEAGGGHYSLTTVAWSLSHSVGRSRVLQALVRTHIKQSSGFPTNGGGPQYSILRQLQTDHSREFISGLSFKHQVNPSWLYNINGDVYSRIEDRFTPAILDAVVPTANSVPSEQTHERFTRARMGLSNVFTINRHVSGELRVGFKSERGTTDSKISATIPDNFELNRPALSLNGGLLFQSGRLTATGGLGVEKSAGVAEVAPRIGVSYRVGSGETRLKTSWGTGFKLPSLEALGDPIVGNPQLKPEYSNGFDVGIHQILKPANLHFSITYYRNSFRNLIDFSPKQFRLVNRGSAGSQGVECTASISPTPRLDLDAHLVFLNTHLLNTPEHLRDLPRWRGGFGIDWKMASHFRSRLDALWVGRRYDFQVPIPDQQTVPKYLATDLIVSYAANERSRFYLRIDNVLNSQYQEFLGFPNGGIYARVGFDFLLVKP